MSTARLTGRQASGNERGLAGWGAALLLAVVPVLAAGAADPSPSASGDWREFRGPGGRGHADPGCRIPLRWNDRRNIAWRTAIPGHGWSSPVVAGEKIWLTTATEGNRSLRLLSLDRRTGKVLQNRQVLRIEQPGRIHSKNSHATPTPILFDGRIYVHFGALGTACVNADGTHAWSTQLPYHHHHGPAGSPVIVDDLLIVSCDGFTRPFYDRLSRPGIRERQFVVAIDRLSGQTRWRRPRIAGRHAYSTPLVHVEKIGSRTRTQLISAGGDRVVSYDPATGRELWWCRFRGYSVVPRPVAAAGLVYVCTGYDRASLLAIRTDGTGDVTDTHIAWRTAKSVPLNPTPLLVGDAVYLVNDLGVASCLDARTGRVRWRRRLGGRFSASPLFVSGHILALSETAVTHVLLPGPSYRRVAVNRLSGRTLATPAVTGNRLLIRTERELVCVEETGDRPADPLGRRN